MSYHVPRRQIYAEKNVTVFKETQYCRGLYLAQLSLLFAVYNTPFALH